MSKIIGIIATVLIAASCFLAWKNYTALKGPSKDGNICEMDNLAAAKQMKKSTTDELQTENANLKEAEELEAQYTKTAEELEKNLEKSLVDLKQAKKDALALKEQHSIKEDEVALADEQRASLPKPSILIPKIKDQRANISNLKGEIATKESQLTDLLQQNKALALRIKVAREQVNAYSSGNSFPSLKTRITSVYRNWGFVTLGAGDKEGVVTGSTLNVTREGEVIAKLKVTAVEEGRASADIILDSVLEGAIIKQGDTVVPQPASVTAGN